MTVSKAPDKTDYYPGENFDQTGMEVTVTYNDGSTKTLTSDYRGKPFADRIRQIIGATVTIVKRNAPHKFEIPPKRWIIERTFGWLDKCRRLWKNCERTLHTSH